MMPFAAYLKEIGCGERSSRDLEYNEAHALFGAMLDGGVPDLELGAIMQSLRFKTEALTELLGFHAALDERIAQLKSPDTELKPVVIPSYNGARRQANLMPLLVMLLKRLGIPVLIHGVLDSEGQVAAAYVLRELGILPQPNSRLAQEVLARDGIAFVPIGALSSGLSNLLSLRNRLGVRNTAHTMAKLIDPFSADAAGGLRMVSVTHPAYADKLRDFFAESAGAALLIRGTEGEAFANPKRRPQIEFFAGGNSAVLFEAEHGVIKNLPALPEECDAKTTAAWIRATLEGKHPIPLPLINQLACCLYGTGYCGDFAQAKAVAAVKSRASQVA